MLSKLIHNKLKVNIYRENQWFKANFSIFNMHFVLFAFEV